MKETLKKEDFKEVMEQDKTVLLDFYADWCGPCQTLLPIVDKLADKHEDDLILVKINVDANPELSAQFKVRSIPALFFMKNGKIEEQVQGVQPESALESIITRINQSAS